MPRGFFTALSVLKKPRKKRPGIHSKNRYTKQKTGKYYCGTKYKGQGR